jgi:hypothetical protein
MRSRFVVVRPGRRPSSVSARRTHLRNVSGVMPSMLAIGQISPLRGVLALAFAPALPWGTSSVCPWLHPLKGWSLPETRGGSGP